MSFGFKRSRRHGIHFDLAREACTLLQTGNLLKKGRNEREFEQAIVSVLESSPALAKNLITQVGDDEVEKVSQAHLFGFKHRPDTAIGLDGTAIEIKAVTRGFSVRDLIGQGFAYRVHYRFVILVLVDQTPDRQVVQLCADPDSAEANLLRGLSEELGIFAVVGPEQKGRNVLFFPDDGSNAASAA